MKLLHLDLGSPPIDLGRPVATIGNFDGLHVGHRLLIRETVARARERGVPSVVLSFDPHPFRILHPEAPFCPLQTLEQRLAAIQTLGVDVTGLVRFDAELARATPERFVEELLRRQLRVGQVLVGRGFRFGHDRLGDLSSLLALGQRHRFETIPVEPELLDGRPISSSRTRQALTAGDVGLAERLLGAPHQVAGLVTRGTGRGKPLSFPTANLRPDPVCLPAPGVYATWARVGEATHAGATFLGVPATFGATTPVLETHLLDWRGGELYGERLTIGFVDRLRDVIAFPSLDALREQIARDVAEARERLERHQVPGR